MFEVFKHATTRMAICATFIGALGCGGSSVKTAAVTGTIKYKGTPLNSGTVQIHGADGRIGSGPILSDGVYNVGDAPQGEVTMTVVVLNTSGMPGGMKGNAKGPMQPGAAPKGTPVIGGDPGAAITIPTNYADKTKSTLKFTIAPGKQTIPLDLK